MMHGQTNIKFTIINVYILIFGILSAPNEKDCRFSQLLLKFSGLGHISEDGNYIFNSVEQNPF